MMSVELLTDSAINNVRIRVEVYKALTNSLSPEWAVNSAKLSRNSTAIMEQIMDLLCGRAAVEAK